MPYRRFVRFETNEWGLEMSILESDIEGVKYFQNLVNKKIEEEERLAKGN